MNDRPTVLFTCCGGSGGWSILRSLEEVGRYRIVGVDSDSLSAGLYAETLDASYVAPTGDDAAYLDTILDIVRKEKVDVVFPLADEEIIALAPKHELFHDAGAKVVTAAPEVIKRAVDKLAVTRRVAAAGVTVPVTCGFDEDLREMPFPVIVRPRTGRGAKNVNFFDTFAEVEAYRVSLGDRAQEHFVQERIPFHLGNLYMAQALYDKKQNLKARFASRSIRTIYDFGGPALGGIPVINAELDAIADRIFDTTGPWFGPVNVEFLYDPERGKFLMLEVNPRYWGYSYLATAAGINFPDLTVRIALGEDVTLEFKYRTDVFTLTSREQLSFETSALLGELPGVRLP